MKITKITLCCVFLLILLACCGPVGAIASNFSMSDLGFTGPQTILIYQSGNLTGVYNTSADIIPVPPSDFQVIIKPEIKNWNPVDELGAALGWIAQYWYAWVVVIGVIILATRRW